jgi:TonB family protein
VIFGRPHPPNESSTLDMTALSWKWPRSVCALAAVVAGPRLVAQTPGATRCDSIVAASKVDSVPTTIFVRTQRLDGELQRGQSRFISQVLASAFMAPRPFQLSVFSGGSQMRVLRRVAPDSGGELRAPTITGVYRYTTTREKLVGRVETLRTSLVPGFDSAATLAIVSATALEDVRSMADGDADSMRVQVRFSTDSMADSFRVAVADFPRMPVVDAMPRRDNPGPAFPPSARADSVTSGEVVLRFVVDRSGDVTPGTIEVARASGIDFLRSALAILSAQRFSPATIRGCSVAQVVDYSFSFVLPATDIKPPQAGARQRD